jgi:hypothetical protein
MSHEQPRTDATSRERSPDHEYTLSIEETADLYAKAGHPRTPRAIQKYCAVSKLDCRKAETETGEKYLVAPYSVERHIAYINELRTVANSRDQSRTDASVRALENKDESSPEQQRIAPNGRVRSPPDERYLERLEDENHFLREQISVKDGQIALKDKTIDALLERDRETNILIAGLQKMLALPGSREPNTGR